MKIIEPLLLLLVLTLSFSSAAAADEKASQKRHPNYMIGRDTGQTQNPTSPLNPNFLTAPEAGLKESGFWRSTYLTESLVGLAVEDINGDGQNEIIYASHRNIYVGKTAGDKLQQLAKYTHQGGNIISLDAFSLDNSGRMQIICSAQDDKKNAASLILSFDGSKLTPVATNIPWYLRVVGPKDSRFLAGQKSGVNPNSFYSGSVMRVKFTNNKIVSQGQVGLPSFVNLFNFTMGRIGSGGLQVTAAIKFPSEHVFLFEGKSQVWETKEEYGGTMNYIDTTNSLSASNSPRDYLPARIILADIDGDGQNELIVAKNDRSGVAFMSKLRAFSGGAMQAFKYANLSLTPFFRTRNLPGPGVDYALADFNNNGTMDLVVAVVTEQKDGMLTDGRSVIIAYELSPPTE